MKEVRHTLDIVKTPESGVMVPVTVLYVEKQLNKYWTLFSSSSATAKSSYHHHKYNATYVRWILSPQILAKNMFNTGGVV